MPDDAYEVFIPVTARLRYTIPVEEAASPTEAVIKAIQQYTTESPTETAARIDTDELYLDDDSEFRYPNAVCETPTGEIKSVSNGDFLTDDDDPIRREWDKRWEDPA